MKKLVLPLTLLALTLVGLLVWHLLQGGGQAAAPLERNDSPAATKADGASALTPLDTQTSIAARSNVTAPAESPTQAVPVATPTVAAAARVRLHGSIVVVDEAGVEHPHEGGTLELVLWANQRGSDVRTTVKDGRYEIDVVPCPRVGFGKALLGGRGAVDTEGFLKDRPFPSDLVYDLRLQWPQLTILHARDAQTGVDLQSIEVLALMENTITASVVPAMTEGPGTVKLRGNSPLPLKLEDFDALPYVETLHVRAPGYGWSMTHFNPRKGGDVFVELDSGADLDVDILGHDPAHPVVLRLTRVGKYEPILERGLGKQQRISLESIPVGRFTVAAEIGMWFENPVQLAKEEIELVAGGRSQVTLALAAQPQSERATLSGVLVVPREWNAKNVLLMADFLGVTGQERDRGRAVNLKDPTTSAGFDTYAWTFESILVGKYEIGAVEPAYTVAIELPVGGRTDVRIEMPPPADVFVRVVDEKTGVDVEAVTLSWNPARPEGVKGGGMAHAERSATTRLFEFRAPLGPVDISLFARSGEYAHAGRVVRLVAGRNEVKLELQRASGVVVSLMDGEELWRSEEDLDFDLEAVEGDGKRTASISSGGEYRLMVTKPGRYRVKLNDTLQGFLPPEEPIVDIHLGSMTPLVIHLKRRP